MTTNPELIAWNTSEPPKDGTVILTPQGFVSYFESFMGESGWFICDTFGYPDPSQEYDDVLKPSNSTEWYHPDVEKWLPLSDLPQI